MSRPGAPGRPRDVRPARRSSAGLEEVLARALGHARAAAGEAALAARALLDAASLGATGVPADGHAPLRGALRWLEGLATSAGGSAGLRWLDALAAALDAEIARWEEQSRTDPEARGVLRAFLGVRELLWELGVRGPQPAPPPEPAEPAPHTRPKPRRGAARALERVPIEDRRPPGTAG
ncbi:MAG: hypothetical protein OZ948_15005 [Deltaproteobacteria bacterium]|nr:hypothetical protein [Deltaproteobacteria bacterium]